ncbi:DUF3769 domain-containing protein [Candidatus Gracilibacteria bacterium]|nr:DUF3769 domain-containing protein [Candidatus Gracilibacteria bacterium]NJM86235.1 DUF3769 domain-containing protein [Hydrococcus sp. RU_2_2]NJP17709.1 DUF3769 domain-containing protein [Hydrococcus sp. CRU_1_1]
MPQYIPPNNPPALVQSIASEKNNDFLLENCTDCSSTFELANTTLASDKTQTIPTYSKQDSTSAISPKLLAFQANHPLLQPTQVPSLPDVKEFSRVPSREVIIPRLPGAVDTTEQKAQSLGAPLAIGYQSSRPTLAIASARLEDFSQTQALKGLEKINLTRDGRMAKVLVIKQRGGMRREFQLGADAGGAIAQQSVPKTETPANPSTAPGNENSPVQTTPTSIVEVIADRQEYDSLQQTIVATGKVEIRFPNGVLVADLVRVNLPDRVAVAEGEVILTRGDQILRGKRFEYYFVQDSGVILQANGEVYQQTTERDFSSALPTDTGSDVVPDSILSDRLALNQPLQRVTTAGGYRFAVGDSGGGTVAEDLGGGTPRTPAGGSVNRVRFQAERVDFDAKTWRATNVRITNDPFSPPELEVRAETATFRNIAPLVDELTLTDSRIVFDQSFSIPTFQDRLVFDRRSRQPGLFSIGYDGRDRGGLFIERGFNIIDTQNVSLTIKPQYLLQRVILPDTSSEDDDINEDIGVISPSAFGLVTDLDVGFSERTNLQATASLSSLDFENAADNLRARVDLRHKIGNLDRPYDLRLEYNYRRRLFNGSLGYQTVNSSLGAIFVSPQIPIADTGINLSYQTSIQYIEALSDRRDLIDSDKGEDLVSLMRYQGAASLSRGFTLWQGEALPPTAEEGLRYTPTPVQPYLQLTTGITGVTSVYSSGDTQPSITGSIGLRGQLGNFSRPFFDYTGFSITYSQGIRGGESPFLFDRFADTQTLSLGLTQQLYGPIRVGVQSSFSLNNSQEISTDYFLEFSRRTYNILLRYNPTLQIGSINLRISDFNWQGNPGTLDGTDVRPVIRGVTR